MAQTTTTLNVEVKDNASKVLRDIGSSLGTIGKLAGVAFGVKEITQALNTYQEFNVRVKNATSSVQEFTAVQSALTNIATKNYASLSNTADLYARLKLTTSDYNLTGKDLVNLTNTITASFKLSNTSAQAQQSVIDNLGKSFLKGTIDGRDFNQILNTAPKILERYAQASGLTINQLQKLAQEGRLSSQGLIAALQQTAAESQNAANAQDATLGQSVINLGNKFVILIGQINDATKFTKGLSLVLDNLDTIVISVGIAMGTFFTILRAGSIITVTTTAVSGLTAAFVALRVAIFAIPVVGWLAAGISLAATGAYLLYENIDKTAKSAKDAGDEIDAWYDSYKKVDPVAKGILSDFDKYVQKIEIASETNQRLRDIDQARLALGRQLTEEEQKRLNIALDQKELREAEKALPGIAKQVGGQLALDFPEVIAEQEKFLQLIRLRQANLLSEEQFQTAISVLQEQAATRRIENNKREIDAIKQNTLQGNVEVERIKNLSAENQVALATSMGMEILNELAKHNEKAFKIAKAAAIAEAIVSAGLAIVNAYKLPFPLNIIMAASIAAKTYSQIQAIRSTQYSGARRQGGLVGENQSYLVGEDGPEMFTPSSSGRITPNDQMGQGVTVNFNISTVDAQGFDEILLNRRSTIVGIINEATNKRGRVGVTQ